MTMTYTLANDQPKGVDRHVENPAPPRVAVDPLLRRTDLHGPARPRGQQDLMPAVAILDR